MASDKTNTIRIELTTEQQRIVKTATDKDVEALELNVEALEERISPTETLRFGSIHIEY
jgi:hypothetical protein